MVALTIVAAGIVGYFISKNVEQAVVFLLPFAAGAFIHSSHRFSSWNKERTWYKKIYGDNVNFHLWGTNNVASNDIVSPLKIDKLYLC